ncbi:MULTISPECIES: cysteine hydrolase family protein [unclassified Nocardiopsis]|uniref:cysteine hydrolase family protein n=1 Tax=Nocardiopsis TaxID=2013 RepID=UPI00387B6DDB
MTRALLVVDTQKSFLQRETWQASSNPDVADDVGLLVAHARGRGDRVVWVLHTEPGTGNAFDPAVGFVELMDGLKPQEGEPVLHKTVHSAFGGTDLQRILNGWGVSEVAVCGIRTEQCCETTTRAASDLGYDVTFVVDATATEPIQAPGSQPGRTLAQILADPLTLGTEDVVTRTVYALSGRFARIATVAEVVGVD